jgi:DNA mismatch repair ATPase MutS
MFTFKDAISNLPVLRFVYDQLPLCSPLGKKELLDSVFINESEKLEIGFQEIEKVMCWQQNNLEILMRLNTLLTSVQDIFGTLSRLKNNDALDDVELFEIKKNALQMIELRQLLSSSSFDIFELYDVNEVLQILDPENTKLPHFYIYSVYSKELSSLRNKSSATTSQEEKEDLLWQISKLENKIRQNLAHKLIPFASHLECNLQYIAKLDLLLAKVALASAWNCCKPEISTQRISYTGLVHPVVAHRLKKENSQFQPVDIDLKLEPCLITGANMTGKSIFLRAIAFSQWMFQFGFYVPAEKATLVPVEKIYFVAGDSDTESTGLSSFVNEIFNIHHILQEVKEEKRLLVLVDEFARTTNPKEGSAFVSAFLEMMQQKPVICLVTSHYPDLAGKFRRLRVKGIQWNKLEHIKTNPQELNKFIDYQLEDCNEKTAPEEAVRIAEILAVDNAFISLVKNYLQ